MSAGMTEIKKEQAKQLLLSRLRQISQQGFVDAEDYRQLRTKLGLDSWSITKLKRIAGSLHQNSRLLKITRVGERAIGHSHPRPYRFIIR